MKAAIVRWFTALMAAKAAARPMWTEPADEPLRVICAWHPGFNPRDPANAGASHGICSECLVRFESGVAA
jgi:hypothetical protein